MLNYGRRVGAGQGGAGRGGRVGRHTTTPTARTSSAVYFSTGTAGHHAAFGDQKSHTWIKKKNIEEETCSQPSCIALS